MFRRFLIPLDRSDVAESALPTLRTLMGRKGCEAHLLLVHQPVPYAGFDDAPWNAHQARDEAEYLERIAEQLNQEGLTTAAAVRHGDPTEMICREAQDIQADAILMSSHGRSGFNRIWMGSVAEGVVKHSPVPVLIVRPGTSIGPNDVSVHRRKILVPLDGSSVGDEIIPQACSLALSTGRQLTLLQVVQPVPWILPLTNVPYGYTPTVYDEETTNSLAQAAKLHLEAIAARLANRRFPVETKIVIDRRVAGTIVDLAKEERVDAIAMSTHGRGLSRLFLGSIADKVLRSADCPILLHRPLSLRTDGLFADDDHRSKTKAA